jgi:RND family efflux transporter MFP subunit
LVRIARTWLLLAAGLALGACARKPPPAPPPPTVIVAQPISRQVQDWDDFVGQFEAVNTVQLRPRVSGYVQSLGFKDGQIVRKGQLLFQIDPRPYQAAYDQAKGQAAHAAATLAEAKTELARARALLAAQATSQQEVDTRLAAERTAEADLESARAAERTAALNLSFTRVAAPIAGKVSNSLAQPGNLVTQDVTILTTVVSLNPIRFRFQAPEALILKYQRTGLAGSAAPARVRLQDEDAYRWPGRLAFVDNSFDPSSGVISAYALIDNPKLFLVPGMFGHMRLQGSAPYRGLLIPDAAVTTDQARQVVLVVGQGGVVAQKAVELGPLIDALRVIRSGLSPSDRVVIDGLQRARPGRAVTARMGAIQLSRALPDAPPAVPPPAAAATFAASP